MVLNTAELFLRSVTDKLPVVFLRRFFLLLVMLEPLDELLEVREAMRNLGDTGCGMVEPGDLLGEFLPGRRLLDIVWADRMLAFVLASCGLFGLSLGGSFKGHPSESAAKALL